MPIEHAISIHGISIFIRKMLFSTVHPIHESIQILNLALAAYQSRQFCSPTSAKLDMVGLTPKTATSNAAF